MNTTDFEDRLRNHLEAKANLIDVPDHQFVQTKVVPFQPRRHRFSNMLAVAAGLIVVLILGYGAWTTTGGDVTSASLFTPVSSSCEVTVATGSEVTVTVAAGEESYELGEVDGFTTIDTVNAAPLIVTFIDGASTTNVDLSDSITALDCEATATYP